MHSRSLKTIDDKPSPPHNAGTEHVGLSPTRQTSRAPSAKREVFGASHEGRIRESMRRVGWFLFWAWSNKLSFMLRK